MHARAANTYRRVYLESASPARVLDELFARLLEDCRQAAEKIARRDVGGKGRAISHALAIVAELSAALDHVAAPEMCANLAGLYRFVEARLAAANVKVDAAPIAEAEKVVRVLREAFQGAAGAGK